MDINNDQPIKYAGFWIRLVASFIDILLGLFPIFIIAAIIHFAFGNPSGPEEISESFWFDVNSLLMVFFYLVGTTYKWGATFGKKIFGIEVRSNKTECLGFWQTVIREIPGKFISFMIFYIGFFMAGFTQKKQALHDKMADTIVIYKNPEKKPSVLKIIFTLIACVISIFATVAILVTIVIFFDKSPQKENNFNDINQTSLSNMGISNINSIQLPQTLTDDEVGFSINYPNGWKHMRDEDKESKLLGTLFGPDVETPPVTVLVQKFEPGIIVDAQGVETAIKNLEQADIDAEGKIYEESDFIYKFDDGTTADGKQFISETYTLEGNKIKKWLAAVPNGNKLVWFAYLAPIEQYDAYYKTAAAMFDSWKILK